MRLARRVAAGMVLGAVVGFLAALLRPRRVRTVEAAGPEAGGEAGPAARATSAGTAPSSPSVTSDEEARPIVLPAQPVTGGTA